MSGEEGGGGGAFCLAGSKPVLASQAEPGSGSEKERERGSKHRVL